MHLVDVLDRVGKADEVRRYEMRSLMQQLVESVLPVRARLAPVDLSGLRAHRRAVGPNRLAVALHCELLEVCREPAEILAVREHRLGLGSEEIGVPHTEQAEHCWGIGAERSAPEVLVDRTKATEELVEPGPTD